MRLRVELSMVDVPAEMLETSPQLSSEEIDPLLKGDF